MPQAPPEAPVHPAPFIEGDDRPDLLRRLNDKPLSSLQAAVAQHLDYLVAKGQQKDHKDAKDNPDDEQKTAKDEKDDKEGKDKEGKDDKEAEDKEGKEDKDGDTGPPDPPGGPPAPGRPGIRPHGQLASITVGGPLSRPLM